MGIANLAMYDLPEVAAANDAWWTGMARALEREGLDGAHRALTRGVGLDRLWRPREALLLAGAEVLPISAYQAILAMEARAQSLGYAEVA